MIGVWHCLLHLLPGSFRTRHGEEFAFYLENEARRMDGATWSRRLGFFARIGLDFASTFQREWRRALPWQIQLALVGVSTLIGLEISSANFFGVGEGLLITTGLFVFQWYMLRSSAVSRARLAFWTVSYVTAGSLLPGILVWFPLGHRQTSLCEMIASAVMATLIVDGIRNEPNEGWVASPVSRANKKHRFSQTGAFSLAAFWPLLAAIAWGRARHLHGVEGFLMTSIYSCYFSYWLGLRLQRIWREPRPFRELPTYVYHYPPGR